MLLLSIIFGTLITLSTTKSLRVCNDCIFIQQCPQAINILVKDRSLIMMEKMRDAVCGSEKEIKICCSDLLEDVVQLDEDKNDEDEIENHPNLRLLPNECGKIPSSRLLGGYQYSQYEFPWVVLIASRVSRSVKFDCEGTLINSKYVLTTAHCLKNKHIFGIRVVDFSNNSRTTTDCYGLRNIPNCKPKHQDISITHTIVHQGYNYNNSLHSIPVNNIGLLRLSRPVNFPDDSVGAVCLPVFRNLVNVNLYGDHGTVAGWSMEGDMLLSNTLLSSTISIHDRDTCRSYFGRYLNYNSTDQVEEIFCAGNLVPEVCIIGEGVPLMLEGEYNNTNKYIQYGIQYRQPTICRRNTPDLYTDIRKYMKWILDFVKP